MCIPLRYTSPPYHERMCARGLKIIILVDIKYRAGEEKIQNKPGAGYLFFSCDANLNINLLLPYMKK